MRAANGRSARALATACALVCVLPGCGSSQPARGGLAGIAPARIVAAARQAAAGAASVHVEGSILSEGEPISVNMELLSAKGGAGVLTIHGLTVRVIELDGFAYVRGNALFYRAIAGARAARKLQGHWLESYGPHGLLAPFAKLTDIRTLVAGALARHGTLSRGAPALIDGQRAVAIEDSANDATLYVAATGTPYPLRIIERGRSRARIVFDRWNRAVTLAAPAHAVPAESLEGSR